MFQPVFDSGRLKAQATTQRARAEQALLAYERTVRQALREVEDALVAIRTLRAEHSARARYDDAIVDHLEVLDTERTLFSAELEESRTRQEALSAVVRLYQVLGGGWTDDATLEATPTARVP